MISSYFRVLTVSIHCNNLNKVDFGDNTKIHGPNWISRSSCVNTWVGCIWVIAAHVCRAVTVHSSVCWVNIVGSGLPCRSAERHVWHEWRACQSTQRDAFLLTAISKTSITIGDKLSCPQCKVKYDYSSMPYLFDKPPWKLWNGWQITFNRIPWMY